MEIKKNGYLFYKKETHIIVLLSDSYLFVSKYQRNFFHWKLTENTKITFSKTENYSEITSKLDALISTWALSGSKYISWIVPSDVMGSFETKIDIDKAVNISNYLPYQKSDVKLSVINNKTKTPQVIYWMHNDWISEFVEISNKLDITCVEFFSRAQLYIDKIYPKRISVIVEGESREVYLHVFSAIGNLVRSTKIPNDGVDVLKGNIDKEINFLESKNIKVLFNSLPEDLEDFLKEKYSATELVLDDIGTLVNGLFKSGVEGIEVNPVYAETLRKFNVILWSVVFAVGIGTSLMIWHDYRLQVTAAHDRASLKEAFPKFQTAKVELAEAIEMSKAIKEQQAMASELPSFKPLGGILLELSQPEVLSSYSQNGKVINVAGTGNTNDIIRSKLEKNKNIRNLEILTKPEVLKSDNEAYMFKFNWLDELSLEK